MSKTEKQRREKMKPHWILMIFVAFGTVTGPWMVFVPAAEVQHVQFGSTVTISCNISYLYDTTWLKNDPDHTPTVVLSASLKEGQPAQSFQVDPRYSVSLMDRSLALVIPDVEEKDLGLYYCIASVNERLIIGTGTKIQVTDPNLLLFHVPHWYCVAVSFVFLILVLTVCITHWKAKTGTTCCSTTCC